MQPIRLFSVVNFLMLLLLHAPREAAAQVPVSNPYAAHYGVSRHWTHAIKWKNALNAREVPGLVKEKFALDSAVLARTLATLSGKGGVLYFPAGTYYLAFDLAVPAGVVIRGAAPDPARDKATAPGFSPPTRFEFSRYNPVAAGAGPAPAAFKRIYSPAGGQSLFGLVHLDVNRAVIRFTGCGQCPPGEQTDAAPAGKPHKNVLVFGIRQNNAALPDPAVPTKAQAGWGNAWQRWPWAEGANVALTVSRNGVVANCLLNDATTDNFRQNNYRIDDGMAYDGSMAMFRYTDHTGILVNPEAAPAPAGKGAATAGRTNVTVTDNRVLVTAGNAAIRTGGAVLDRGNQVSTLTETPSAVRKGRFPVDTRYTLLYANDSLSQACRYVNRTGDTLPYRLIKPRHYDPRKKYPVVLFFHAPEQRGSDNRQQLKQFVWQFATEENQEQFPCFVIAPQCPASQRGWVAAFALTWMVASSVKILDGVAAEYNIDPDRMYVVGISQGGEAVWDLAARFPEKFAAAASFGAFYRFSEEAARAVRHVPVWALYGDTDERVPAVQTRLMLISLQEGGNKPKQTEFKDTGHLCWDKMPAATGFMEWLFSQRR